MSTKIASSRQRPRNIYEQKTKTQLQCRVCLTQSNNVMYDLVNENELVVEETFVGYRETTIQQALEKVTSLKVLVDDELPRKICPVCLSFLKISLKFILQFEESQKRLYKMLGETTLDKSEEKLLAKQEIEQTDPDVPVEIIFGTNKFSLNQLLVVDKDEKEKCNFGGFLKNLGKEVSASFIEKSSMPAEKTEETTDEVSISLLEKDRVLPVKELQLNEETNQIEYVIEDDPVDDEIIELAFEEEEEEEEEEEDTTDEQEENLEYIEMDANNADVFIIETRDSSDDTNEKNSFNKERGQKNSENVFILETRDSSDDTNKKNSFHKELGQKKHGKRRKKEEENDGDEDEENFAYPCDLCKRIYSTKLRLKVHKKRTHSSNPKMYFCDICGYKNNTLSAHKNHMLKHVGKKWVCEICQKPYYTKAVLKVHLETHRNKRQHLCNVCGKGFNYANALVYHMRLHTGEKKYECKFCCQRFRMSYSLKRHLRTHTGERPYSCKFCNRPFSSSGEVAAHEMIHTGYRPYHCAYCGKGFTKSHNLKVHLLTHEGEYKCELCSKSFVEGKVLDMHYRNVHRDSYLYEVYESKADQSDTNT